MRDPTSPAVPGKLPGYRLRAVGVVHFGLAVLGGFLLALGGVLLPSSSLTAAEHKPAVSPEAPSLDVRLVPDKPHTLEIPDKVLTSLAIRAAAKKGKDQKVVSDLLATAEDPWNEAGKPDRKIKTRTLVLEGSTALDASRLRRIRAPFAPAEVVEIGQVSVNPNGDRQDPRELRAGDHVKEGQLLAVLSSAEVGLKKMELIDTVVLLKFDEKIRDLADKGGVPDVLILNYQRNVEVDQSNVARALNTLKAWNIPKKDIDDCLAVADEIIKRRGKREHKEADLARWARVELRAPIDGIIVERNVIQHEIIDDKTVNLFQIANVDRLLVIANCPEENLPALAAYAEELDKNQDKNKRTIPWTVQTAAALKAPGLGHIDDIGYLIDPNQHAALIRGTLPNPRNQMRAGQFVTATIHLPAPKNVVAIPIDALVDDDRQSIVFVETDKAKHQYTMRRVLVVERFEKTAYVRSKWASDEEKNRLRELDAARDGPVVLPIEFLQDGDRVLQVGVLELEAALRDLEREKASKDKGKP